MRQAVASENKISVPIHRYLVTFRERMKALRKEYKLTQQQLAYELNVSRSCIASWETGDRIPNIQNLKDMTDLYNVTSDYLLGFVEKRNETRPFVRNPK